MIEAAKQVPKHILIERLMDYERMDQAALLAALVAKWREYHPAAAQEQSAALKPLDRHETLSLTTLFSTLCAASTPTPFSAV